MQERINAFYQALAARDARFDGTFFVAVTSTGIYCRPICTAKTPRQPNCLFFNTAQEAEQAHFRPCLRCRPELAPGNAPVDRSQRIAYSILQRLEEGTIENDAGLEAIATQFALSSRQVRRIIQNELGVSPIQLLLTRRLLLAKQLLTDTALPVTHIAYASGFSSLRRFNDAFNARYRLAPSQLRKSAANKIMPGARAGMSTLQLSYRPPYDWDALLAFLRGRELKGVEWVGENFYARTVQLGGATGWIRVSPSTKKNSLALEVAHSLMPALPALMRRLRNLFDLTARPDIIAQQLGQDPHLAPLVKRAPGLRVPGAFDGFEVAARAIIGQQLNVKSATTIACRFAAAFGEPFATLFPELNRLTPVPTRVAVATVDAIASLGILATRSKTIIALAKAVASQALVLDEGLHVDPEHAIERLTQLPGIGSWTAHYIAMRVLRWPDAFLAGDVIVRKQLGGVSAKQAEALSQAWRPWRSYAVLHLWQH